VTAATADTAVPHAPAAALVAALRRREVASRELLAEYLDRVDRLNPRINAVVTVDAERAVTAAAAADAAAARGKWLGPLHGLPVTVKDTIATAGLRTTAGAADLSGYVPDRDATVVARLRAAGAVVFGKTNTPEYAADAQTYNEVFGTTGNPWDPDRSPGGSSGGSAAAVGAGLTALEVGSDLGGSIRMPAGYCGVYGLRPSAGLVPAYGHIPPAPGDLAQPDMAVIGPLARAADDLALALDAIAGPERADAAAWRLELPPPRAHRLADYRMVAWLDDPTCPVDTEVLDVLATAVDALRAAGVRVTDGAGPAGVAESARLFQRLCQPSLAHLLPAERFDELCAVAASGTTGPHRTWARHVTQRVRDWSLAHERRLRLAESWRRLFTDHDVLVCPVTPTPALPHDHRPEDARRITVNGRPVGYWQQVRWTQAISPVRLPVAAVPVGLSRSGLPVGVQVVGPYLADRTVVDVARRLAGVVGGFRPPPGW
jgi:amidase